LSDDTVQVTGHGTVRKLPVDDACEMFLVLLIIIEIREIEELAEDRLADIRFAGATLKNIQEYLVELAARMGRRGIDVAGYRARERFALGFVCAKIGGKDFVEGETQYCGNPLQFQRAETSVAQFDLGKGSTLNAYSLCEINL